MDFQKGHHPGAQWHKSDLQCHSPRDHGWDGSPDLPGGTEENEAARHAWAASFVAACKGKGLRAVAITDHHDACLVEYVQKHVESDPDCDLKVFAGIEVTCDDVVQCLVIFDSTSKPSDWDRFLSKLNMVVPAQKDGSKTCEIKACGLNIADLFNTISNDKRLKEICLLIPHFGKSGSHKSLNAEKHHPRFIELDCDGFYFESPFSEIDGVTLQKARGDIKEWGKRRRAMIATGDNRRDSWDRLGLHDCWIKIGEFSTEAIRQAFLADEARIAHEEPTIPTDRIVELRVLSSLTGDQPMTMSLNAGYTAFIGGRGSGKSALLEYMRFGLGRSEQDIGAIGQSKAIREREANLLTDTLKDGYVEVVIKREGSREVWRRMGADSANIEVSASGRQPEKITIEAAQRRFRARAFHQKELSTTMSDGKSNPADHITGIVAAEEMDKRRAVDQEIEGAKRSLTTALQMLASHWQSEFQHSQAKQVVDDLAHRIATLNQNLKEAGVNEDSLKIIEQAPLYGRARNFFKNVEEKVEEDVRSMSGLKDAVLRIDVSNLGGARSFNEVDMIEKAVASAKELATGYLVKTIEALEGVGGSLKESSARFEVASLPFAEKLEQATAAQQAHKALLADMKKLTEQQTLAEAAFTRATEQMSATAVHAGNFDRAITDFDALHEKRRGILSESAQRVQERSKNLEAKMKLDKKPVEYAKAVAAVLDGSGIREVPDRCQAWIETVMAEGGGGWSGVRSKLLAIYRSKIANGSPQSPEKKLLGEIVAFCKGGSAITENQATRIYGKLNDQVVSSVIAATPRDFIQLTYIDEATKKVQFERASPGQQASALLELLLQQQAGTLIIDQPEDDLDNRVIMRIVDLIKTSKNLRQLIFATHNPNLVVNGDADKVVALKSAVPGASTTASVEIDIDGAIETEKVRDAITMVMEGGRAAFDLRGKKYRFESPRMT